MTTAVPVALHVCYGYSLYRDAKGKPYVKREWTTKKRDANGVSVSTRHTSRLELLRDSFAALGPQATIAFHELSQAWKEWTDWQTDNGKG